MRKVRRPDVLLYTINVLVVVALCIVVSGIYWAAWKSKLSIDTGPAILGFHAQTFLGLDFASYLAKELERTLTSLLKFSVPIVGVCSLFAIEPEYEVLWWSKIRPKSIRARIYSSLLLLLGSFAALYLSTNVVEFVVRGLPLADEEQLFVAVSILTALFFSLVSTAMLAGVIGFVNAFERSVSERKKR